MTHPLPSLPFPSPSLPHCITHLQYLDQIGDTYFGLKVNAMSGTDLSPGGIMEGLFSVLSGDAGDGGQGLGGLGEGEDLS